jgi:hypothetical protein
VTTTTNLRTPTTPRARLDGLPLPVATCVVIFCLLSIAGLVGKVRSEHATVVQPTPGLIILIATQAAVVVPTAAPIQVAAVAPNTLRRAVVAYDSPNGNVIGAIEQGRAYTVLARFGSDWLQADVVGSGAVWLKADQVLDLPADLVDLAPTAAPVIVYQPVYQPAYAAPTPAPEQYQITNEAPTPAPQQVVLYDREQWAMDAQRAAGR